MEEEAAYDLELKAKKREVKQNVIGGTTRGGYGGYQARFLYWLYKHRRAMLTDDCIRTIEGVPIPRKAGKNGNINDAHTFQIAKKLKDVYLRNPLEAEPWMSDQFDSVVVEDWYVAMKKLDNTASSSTFLKNGRSAVKDLYRSYNIQLSVETERNLKQLYTGMRKMEAQRKSEEGGKITEGKDPLPFSIFKQVALNMMKKGGPKSIFCHFYLVLSWNLGCRTNNVEKLCFDHIELSEDALLFRYCFTKTDQVGADNEPRHVYANSVNPEISAFLSLAIYLATVRKETVENKQRVFPGNSQYNRFLEDLKEILNGMSDELEAAGRKAEDLGAHSIRKGVGTFASSAEDGPSHTSLCRRLCWAMDSVQEKYLKYQKAGDQVCGRYFAGLPRGEPEFALPPPFFLPGNDALVSDAVKTCFGDQYPHFRGVLGFCLASLIYHYQFLKDTLKASHMLWQNPLFLNLEMVGKLGGIVVCRLLTPTDQLACTGLTTNAKQTLEFRALRNTVIGSIEELKEENKQLRSVVDEISVSVVGSVTNLMEERALDAGNITRSNLESMLSKVLDPMKEKIDSIADNGVVPRPEVLSLEEEEEDKDPFQRFLYNGQFHRYPQDFSFPEGNALSVWVMWKFGNRVQRFAPLSGAEPRDFVIPDDVKKSRNMKKRFSDLKTLVRYLEVNAAEFEEWEEVKGQGPQELEAFYNQYIAPSFGRKSTPTGRKKERSEKWTTQLKDLRTTGFSKRRKVVPFEEDADSEAGKEKEEEEDNN